MTTIAKAKPLRTAWRETAPRFLIRRGATVRYGDRSCLVTDILQDQDGRFLYLMPVGTDRHFMVSEHRWDLLSPDTAD